MRVQGRTAEEKIGWLANRQHGVVARGQLAEAGISAGSIERRLRSGLLLPEHRGVYRVGHRAPSLEATYLAAVLACGAGSLLSGQAAAHLLRLVRGAAPDPEVTTPTERRVARVRTTRSRYGIDRRDTMAFRRIPVTTPARTLVDLAALLPMNRLARACHEAGVLYETTPAQIESVLKRRPSSPGATTLRSIVRGEVRVTLSKLEARFLELLGDAGLPLPVTNRLAGGRRVDCRWPEHRLTVELDGFRFHRSRYAWEQDRHREREARARGDEFRRYTSGDVLEQPRLMLRELEALFQGRVPA
jgi:hypothetical protein